MASNSADDKGWTFDAFDPGTMQLAGKKELENYQQFLTEYTSQIKASEAALDETIGDAWDFTLDPIALQASHYEHASMLELIKTEHKILNKVVTVFAALCSEIDEHKTKARTKFYLPLVLYGESGALDGSLQEGEAQLMMGRMLHILQDLTMFINRVNELVKSAVQQMASLYSSEGFQVINASGIHLQTVFERISDAMGILITLDHIFQHQNTLREHWEQYKRIITSIKGAPTEYGVDETKLRPFEKLLQTLEGKLMDGNIFNSCVNQIFDTREVDITHNKLLSEEFSINLDTIYASIVARVGEASETTQRSKLIGFCGLIILHYKLYNVTDRKFLKAVFDLHKRIPGVHVIANLVWFHTDFLRMYLPQVPELNDKKQLNIMNTNRGSYLTERSNNLPRMAQSMYMQVSIWMVRMDSEFTVAPQKGISQTKSEVSSKATVFIQGLLLAYSISNCLKIVLSMHFTLNKAISKASALAACRLMELLKCIQYTFHRRALLVAESILLIMNHYELGLLSHVEAISKQIQQSRAQKKGYSEIHLDVLAAYSLMKTMLNGPGTKERRLVASLAFHFSRPKMDDDRVPGLMRKLDAVCDLREQLQTVCDCSLLYWHKEALMPIYFANILRNPTNAHRLHYIFAALRDSVPTMRWSRHFETPETLLKCFEQEIDKYLKEKILDPLCLEIEADLRLSSHLHLQQDDRNPFKVGLSDLRHFTDVKPIRFFDRSIDIKACVTHYLDSVFYNLTTLNAHDWKTYGDMRNLAEQKYGLAMLEPHLPSGTLEQGLDVLEIMKHIDVFVTQYCYNLNNQIFVERKSDNKFLNTINIRHIANSIRTHGTGIMNTTVNFTYQFLRKRFFTFSQFMYDEYIKARLLKEIRVYRETKDQLHQMYPVARAERFNKVIRNLGSNQDGLGPLDQFRILITQIGNAMGYIRMIRSGGLNCCSNAIRFVPDLEDIVVFEDILKVGGVSEDCITAAKIFDAAVGNLAKNFAEGTEYFKLLVDVFSPVFRTPKSRHLQNFYMVVPPLTLNYVEYIMNAKDKINKKNKQGAAFTDDGFSMGIAYILKLVDQYHAFDSLHWFDSVFYKYKTEMRKVRESGEKGKGDEKLQATISLSLKRIENYMREFELLNYSLSSARIFFRADLTAQEEEDKQKAEDGAAAVAEQPAQPNTEAEQTPSADTGAAGAPGPPGPPGVVPPPPPPPPLPAL